MAKMYQTRSLLEWKDRVANWIKIYGRDTQDITKGFDPTKVVAVKYCIKCGKWKERMQRHHIGSEMAFAKILPEYYARRYVSFHAEDIAWLCTRHHKQAHIIYKPLMDPVYEYAKVCQIKGVTPNPHHLELFRQTIRKAFDKWVTRKPYKKKKKNARSTGKQSSSNTDSRSRRKSRRNNHPGRSKRTR